MGPRNVTLYRCADTALLRAAQHARLPLPPWPEVTGDGLEQAGAWRSWLTSVWSLPEVCEAIEQASPVLARKMEAISSGTAETEPRQMRRTLVSVIRYMQRMTGRATPNGLFAGVAVAGFGEPEVCWGTRHRVVAHASAEWISTVIDRLESCPELLDRLPLLACDTAFVRGERLVVPYPARSGGTGGPVAEATVRHTSAVRTALDAARAPISYGSLVDKVGADFPDAPPARVRELVSSLISGGALVSALRPPSTVLDPLAHLVHLLDEVSAGDVPPLAGLRAVHDGVRRHNRSPSPQGRRDLRRRMGEVAPGTGPLRLDLRVDCSLALPSEVAREAERAVTLLACLSPAPFGTPGWRDFHTRFFERYGIGSLVPLRDVVDPDVGLGFPAGYLSGEPEPREPVSAWERRLLVLAQAAVLDGCDEIQVDEELCAGERDGVRMPPHLEVSFQVAAASVEALARGEFTLSAVRPSRGAGTLSGRFLALLGDEERGRAVAVLRNGRDALSAQLSFGPLDRYDADVVRVPDVLPHVISLGEHRPADDRTIPLDDLAVGCDPHRLYLVSRSRGRVVEPQLPHALDLRTHALPLGRFLAEISRAQSAVITAFPWGAAADLPYLPRVRHGRTVLSLARWLLPAADLPGPAEPWERWHAEVGRWRERRRVPETVALTEGDQLLPLDLSTSAHRAVLRSHLSRAGSATLTEIFPAGGWFGGRAHEVVVPMTIRESPSRPAMTRRPLLDRDHGHLPGAPGWLLAKLYARPERHPDLLSHLLASWETPPAWWFTRHHDPRPHLRLRIEVTDTHAAAEALTRISARAQDLRRAGLVCDVQFATSYPEPGRWGTGALLRLAEDVFAADSRALLAQFARPHSQRPHVLTVANFVSLTTAFTGGVQEAMTWLSTYGGAPDDRPLDRAALHDAVRLADPADDWAALRALPGGAALVTAWNERDRAIVDYRARLPEPEVDPVLDSLLHAHHIRATGVDKDDERRCARLVRAVARSWTARHQGASHGTT